MNSFLSSELYAKKDPGSSNEKILYSKLERSLELAKTSKQMLTTELRNLDSTSGIFQTIEGARTLFQDQLTQQLRLLTDIQFEVTYNATDKRVYVAMPANILMVVQSASPAGLNSTENTTVLVDKLSVTGVEFEQVETESSVDGASAKRTHFWGTDAVPTRARSSPFIDSSSTAYM